MQTTTTVIYLALGSNLGDRLANLDQAKKELSLKITINQISNAYETPPWGYESQPPFLNQVLSARTSLNPDELLLFAKGIEKKMGRLKTFTNGPRLIDIDILLFGDQTIHEADLIIPHPRMLERAFVLVPLAEIAPNLVIPSTALSVRSCLRKINHKEIMQIRALV
jgi:2-amino-4-hydroxy-6-hydroxymethyldihydropteridine diphosphokinase